MTAAANRVASSNRRPADLSDYKDFPSYVRGYFGASLVAAWLLQDQPGSLMAAAINNASALGRNISSNGTFDTDTAWSKGTGWTIAGGVAHSDGTGVSALLSQTISQMAIGKAFQVTFTVLNYVSGSVRVLAGNASAGAVRSANGTYTEILIAGTADSILRIRTETAFVGDIDNVLVQQVNIPSNDSYGYKQLLIDGDMEAVTTAAYTAGNSAALSKIAGGGYNGGKCIRVQRNGGNNPYASQTILTIGKSYRVYGWWRSDGSASPRIATNSGVTALITIPSGSGSAWHYFEVLFVATATDLNFMAVTTTSTQFCEFSGVVCAEDNFIRTSELVQDGTMEKAGVGDWVAFGSATLSKQSGVLPSGLTGNVLRVLRASNGNPSGQQTPLCPGKTYRVRGWGRGDGTDGKPRLSTDAVQVFLGTNSTAWQFVDILLIATTTNMYFGAGITASGYAEWWGVSVVEVPPMSGVYTNGAAPGSAGLPGELAVSLDGTNDNVNIYSADLNSVLPTAEGTVAVFIKVNSDADWSDGISRYYVRIGVDNNTQLLIRKSNSSNRTVFYNYTINGVALAGAFSTASGTNFFCFTMTWSKSGDVVVCYANGVAVGTLNGLGTWIGNLATNTAAIGAQVSTGAGAFKGLESNVILLNRAATAAEILEMARREGLAA